MAIDGEARNAERVTEHDVRRLAADARQSGQLVHVRGHLTAVPLDEPARHAHEAARLHAEKPRRDDLWLELLWFLLRQRRGVRISREERRRYDVDARIGG